MYLWKVQLHAHVINIDMLPMYLMQDYREKVVDWKYSFAYPTYSDPTLFCTGVLFDLAPKVAKSSKRKRSKRSKNAKVDSFFYLPTFLFAVDVEWLLVRDQPAYMTKLECHRWQAVHFQMCYSRLKPQAKCLRWCFHRHLISFPFLSQQDMYVYILHTCQLTNPQNWKIAGSWAFFVERCQEASPKDAMSWQLKISNWSLPRQKLAALPFLVVSYMPSSMPVICNEDFFTSLA